MKNNSLPLEWINKINKRKNDNQISTFDFSTLYIKILHEKLLDILCKVVYFVFKGDTRDYIVINKQSYASWSSKKRGHQFVFTKLLLIEATKFLLHNFFFLSWIYHNDSSNWNTNGIWPNTMFCKPLSTPQRRWLG